MSHWRVVSKLHTLWCRLTSRRCSSDTLSHWIAHPWSSSATRSSTLSLSLILRSKLFPWKLPTWPSSQSVITIANSMTLRPLVCFLDLEIRLLSAGVRGSFLGWCDSPQISVYMLLRAGHIVLFPSGWEISRHRSTRAIWYRLESYFSTCHSQRVSLQSRRRVPLSCLRTWFQSAPFLP